MSIPMKCEKCGAVSGFAPRFPCVHPPCDGERYLDKDALRTEVLTEVSPAPAAPGVDKLRYGPTADQMHTLRTAFQNEWSGQVPGGFRLTVENVLTEAFQAGIKEGRKETLPLVRAVLDWRNARALYRHYLVLRPRVSEAELNRAKNDMDEALDNLAALYTPETVP